MAKNKGEKPVEDEVREVDGPVVVHNVGRIGRIEATGSLTVITGAKGPVHLPKGK